LIRFASRHDASGTGLATMLEEAQMRLNAIMNTAVEVIGPHASVGTAERRLREKGIHHLVVVDHDIIVGLLTQDILENRKGEGAKKVEDAMLRNITLAAPEMTVREAAALMTPGHAQTAVPVVRNQRLVGIVTVSDLLRLAATAHRQLRDASAAIS
jgi:CBS domain-containing protein